MTILWIVGEPGVGKTTLTRRFLSNFSIIVKPKWTVGEGVVAAGHYKNEPFDGADTVPYNGAAEALDYWKTVLFNFPLTIFDGDRFSNAKAVNFFRRTNSTLGAHGRTHDLLCALLVGPEQAAQRRLSRGSDQDVTWIKGRVTKSKNFYDSFAGPKIALDAARSPIQLHAALTEFLKEWK